MKPHSIGRTLGIGLRVAGRIAGQRVAAGAQAADSAPAVGESSDRVARRATAGASAQKRAVGQATGQVTWNVARGVGGFLRPFQRVGGIVWLEVTGVFFFLPVIVFAPSLWRIRASWLHGPDHRTFLVTAGIVLVFFYLSVSSFWRARRK
jgi:hypothetical protein